MNFFAELMRNATAALTGYVTGGAVAKGSNAKVQGVFVTWPRLPVVDCWLLEMMFDYSWSDPDFLDGAANASCSS